MENIKNTKTPEMKYEEFGVWLKNLNENGRVGDIDSNVVRFVLEAAGANFEISESAKESLSKYSNKSKRDGLNEVWGSDKVDDFKFWVINEYIPYIEKAAGRELHTLWDGKVFDDVKHSGMMQFLGELTAFAAGVMPIDKYRRITENRYFKGKKWQYGDREEIYIPSKNASFPVDFPQKAISKISSKI